MKRQRILKLKKKENKVKIQKKQILWFFCSFLLVCCVFLTIQGSSTGAELLVLEEEKLSLIEQNQELSVQIVNSTSLLKIEEVAEDLGFSQPAETLYITEEKSVAKLP